MSAQINLTDNIVVIHHHRPFTNTLAVVEGCGLEHDSVIKLVRKYVTDFEEFSPCRFEIRPFMTKGGMQKQEKEMLVNYFAKKIDNNHNQGALS